MFLNGQLEVRIVFIILKAENKLKCIFYEINHILIEYFLVSTLTPIPRFELGAFEHHGMILILN
ncbi:hypothetical protein F993_00084 [Acinetobacter proteolyticus]|jgi:hypothetical protein|uniref:Uncharacterized protein n=1 Tax=Acinetobacter proteolyticus TaxID=1776741 RepID=A0A653K3T3_9GAMM|nr:hypothetical protein F993_00084 [Acinetobacter proteolyticus]OEY91657.1 hypothetical protein BJD20_11375 [Acinetobacter proteolyticus]PKF32662.1 hypothetical protein CW311_13605 [Acinetobacter proteolyticus]VXA55507.1 conserved hypothetical protein [Acinetobacter proteolyticus]